MRRLAALLLATLMPSVAAADGMRLRYEVYALGAPVMELQASFELTGEAYRVETRLRTRGLAALVASGEQASRSSGAWAGAVPRPAGFVSEGVWRGRSRRIALGWQGGEPGILELTPSEAGEREPVPESMRRGSMDVLSALAMLVRQVAREGHCNLAAPVFDGRRRSDYAASSHGREMVSPWRGGWHGEALRCDFEGRLVAGFRFDQERARAAEPQRATAWIAAPYAGATAVPVRLDIPTRWFGTATAVLLHAEPVARGVEFGR